jgi:PAS domain S-box-containing protein
LAGAPDLGKDIGRKFRSAGFWADSARVQASSVSVIENAVNESLSGKTVIVETDFYLYPERPEKIKLHLIPQNNSAGQTEEIFFSALNISPYINETSFYKERSEQLLFAAETAEVGLFFWDVSKDNIFTTPKFNALYGLGPDEIMTPESFMRVIHPEDISLVEETIKRSHADYGECNTEYRVIVNGNIRWVWIRGKSFPGTDSAAAFTMGSGRDITAKKLSDEQLIKLYALEKQSRNVVEKANQTKDQFIATVSHELRAPLNSILGWVKILLSKEVDESTRTSALQTIERSARVQAKLIGDLVDSSKIISGKLNLEFHPVDLSNALSFVLESQKPMAEAKNIEFEHPSSEEGIRINADLSRLQQIFTNLITNAIKFTPDGGKITVESWQDKNIVYVSVKDTGKGIEAEELPFIFERFFQAKVSESADKSGLGLGLSIVSSLVKQHGGAITAESAGSGQGAVFTVALPILEISEMVKKNEKDQSFLQNDPLDAIRILLVEDNDDSREVLEIFLKQMGADITPAASAAEALKSLNSNGKLPHVLISDISMPEEDGFSLIRKIRKMPAEKGGSMPAIALTAFGSPDDKRRVLESGFQLHHSKPFEPELLIREILEVIK